MRFDGRFVEHLIPEQLHRLSVSFLVSDFERRRGGNAANMCYGMAQLGLRPILVGAVGPDFDDYRAWLDRHGVDTASVHVSPERYTARFVCTTDADDNQIATFYAGAMADAREIDLGPVAARVGGIDLLVVGPNDPDAMVRHTREARDEKISYMADPSQQLSSLHGDEIRELVRGARFLVTNDYEAALLESKTGWSREEVLAQVGVRITTHGPDGCVIERAEEEPIKVAAAPEEAALDPTGVGDAFRAGLVAGQAWGLDLERACQVGAALATYVLETVGPQEYSVTPADLLARLAGTYGESAADEVAPHLLLN